MIHTTSSETNITIVRPGVERLTAVNAKVFKNEISELIDQGADHLIIDFTQVKFLDSSGLGAVSYTHLTLPTN